MDLLHVIVLALLQGLTEFLPISSSAHLILPSKMVGWPDQGLAFDVATHVGTLAAVMLYFRRDIVSILQGWFATGFSSSPNQDGRLGWYIIVATLPAGVCGILLDDWIEANLRSSLVIAITTLTFGVLLLVADLGGKQAKTLAHLTIWTALLIGLFQALALVPGTSRSGITITAALLLGFQRESAARYSFLLSIPLILAAGSLKTLELIYQAVVPDWQAIVLGTLVSAISAYICIYYFLALINKIGMLPFVLYRLILGGVLLMWFV